MNTNAQIVLLAYRLKNLIASEKENHGVQQKISRRIRKLKEQCGQANERSDQARTRHNDQWDLSDHAGE